MKLELILDYKLEVNTTACMVQKELRSAGKRSATGEPEGDGRGSYSERGGRGGRGQGRGGRGRGIS